MANMTNAQRTALWAEYMQDISNAQESCSVTKGDLRAAVDALDAWVDGNAATINQAIPQPARGALNTAQKARLLSYVIRQRYIVGA
jgi:hypothetical protein